MDAGRKHPRRLARAAPSVRRRNRRCRAEHEPHPQALARQRQRHEHPRTLRAGRRRRRARRPPRSSPRPGRRRTGRRRRRSIFRLRTRAGSALAGQGIDHAQELLAGARRRRAAPAGWPSATICSTRAPLGRRASPGQPGRGGCSACRSGVRTSTRSSAVPTSSAAPPAMTKALSRRGMLSTLAADAAPDPDR